MIKWTKIINKENKLPDTYFSVNEDKRREAINKVNCLTISQICLHCIILLSNINETVSITFFKMTATYFLSFKK